LSLAKWLWLAAVLVMAGWLLYRSRESIVAMLAQVSPGLLAASLLLTVLAKGFLAENARIAAQRNGILMGFLTSARLYNLSQLGKYLPGSIWQFVGRAAAYRARGAAYGPIRDALLVESLWVVAGSAVIGVLLVGPQVVGLVTQSLTPMLAWWLGGGLLASVLLAVSVLLWKRRLALHYAHLAMPSVRVAVVQAGIWVVLGLAFWVLTRACRLEVSPVFATGLFAVGYSLGFLVPFAPAGLGIRDAILTIGLVPYVPAGEALAVTILARVIYLLVDVGLAVVQEPLCALVAHRRVRSLRG
jgi:hypothetical protein